MIVPKSTLGFDHAPNFLGQGAVCKLPFAPDRNEKRITSDSGFVESKVTRDVNR